MIIDTTQTKIEQTLSNRQAVYGFCLACEEYTLERMDDGGIRCYSCQAEMHLTMTITNEQKEEIIAKALQTDEGRKQLAEAMIEPRRCGGLEYV